MLQNRSSVKHPFESKPYRYNLTYQEWEEEQLYSDTEVLERLEKHGCVYTRGLEYRRPIKSSTHWYSRYYRTPFDYFLRKREKMSTTEESAFQTLDVVLTERIENLKKRDKEINESIIRFMEEQEKVQTEIKATTLALSAYTTGVVEQPSGTGTGLVGELVPPMPGEHTRTETPVEPETAQEPKVQKPRELNRVNKTRAALTPAEEAERDTLRDVIMYATKQGPFPGEITMPDAARATQRPEVYGSQGKKKFAFADAFNELVQEGKLIRTEEKVWPNPTRTSPPGPGGRTAILYRAAHAVQQQEGSDSPLGKETVSPT